MWIGNMMDSGACPGLRSGIRRNDKIAAFIQLCKSLNCRQLIISNSILSQGIVNPNVIFYNCLLCP